MGNQRSTCDGIKGEDDKRRGICNFSYYCPTVETGVFIHCTFRLAGPDGIGSRTKGGLPKSQTEA